MNRTAVLGAVAFSVVLAAACGGNAAAKLEGNWALKSNAQIGLTLKSDGNAIERYNGKDMPRTWRVDGGNLCVKASEADGGRESCMPYTLDGNNLTWVGAKYQRQ